MDPRWIKTENVLAGEDVEITTYTWEGKKKLTVNTNMYLSGFVFNKNKNDDKEKISIYNSEHDAFYYHYYINDLCHNQRKTLEIIATFNRITAWNFSERGSLWGVCVDFLCDNKVKFNSVNNVPGYSRLMGLNRYDEAFNLMCILQDHGEYERIWEACRMMDKWLAERKPPISYIKEKFFNVENMIEWYKKIDQQNPHYQDAQTRLSVLQLLSDREVNKVEILKSAIRSEEQALVDAALPSMDNQSLADVLLSLQKENTTLKKENYDLKARVSQKNMFKEKAGNGYNAGCQNTVSENKGYRYAGLSKL